MPGSTGSWRRRLDRTAKAESYRRQREQENSGDSTSPDSSRASSPAPFARKRSVLGSSTGANTPPRSTWSGAIVTTSIPTPRAPAVPLKASNGSWCQRSAIASAQIARTAPIERPVSPQDRFFAEATAASLALGAPRSSYNAQSWAELDGRRRMRDDIADKLQLIAQCPDSDDVEEEGKEDEEGWAAKRREGTGRGGSKYAGQLPRGRVRIRALAPSGPGAERDDEDAEEEEAHFAPSTLGDVDFSAAFEREKSSSPSRLQNDSASTSVDDSSPLNPEPRVLFSLGTPTEDFDAGATANLETLGRVMNSHGRRCRSIKAAQCVRRRTSSSNRLIKALPTNRAQHTLATAAREEEGDDAPHKRRITLALELDAPEAPSPSLPPPKVQSSCKKCKDESCTYEDLFNEHQRLTELLESRQLVHDLYQARIEALDRLLGKEPPAADDSEPSEASAEKADFTAKAARLFDQIQCAAMEAPAVEPPRPKQVVTENWIITVPQGIVVGPAPPLPSALHAPAYLRSQARPAKSKQEKQVLVRTRRENLWPAPTSKYPLTVSHMLEKARTMQKAGVPLSPSMQRVVDSDAKLRELLRSRPPTGTAKPSAVKVRDAAFDAQVKSVLLALEAEAKAEPDRLALFAHLKATLTGSGDERKIDVLAVKLRVLRSCASFSAKEVAEHRKLFGRLGVSLPSTWGTELDASLALIDPIFELLNHASEAKDGARRMPESIMEGLIDLLTDFLDVAVNHYAEHRDRVRQFVEGLMMPTARQVDGTLEVADILAEGELSSAILIVAYGNARSLSTYLSKRVEKETMPLALALDTNLLQLALRIVAVVSKQLHAVVLKGQPAWHLLPRDRAEGTKAFNERILRMSKEEPFAYLKRLAAEGTGSSSSESDAAPETAPEPEEPEPKAEPELKAEPEPTRSAIRRAQRKQQRAALDGTPESATPALDLGADRYVLRILPMTMRRDLMRTRMSCLLQFLIGHLFPPGALSAAMTVGGLMNDYAKGVGANCDLGISEICSTVMTPAMRKLQVYEHAHQDRSAAMLLTTGVALRSVLTRFDHRESDAMAFGYTVASEAGLRRLFAVVERQLETLERNYDGETGTFFRQLEAGADGRSRLEVGIELYRGVDLKAPLMNVLKLLSEVMSALLKAQVASHMEKERGILKREAHYELDPWDVDDRLSENSLEMRRSKLFDGGVGPELSLEALCIALPQVFCDALERETLPEASKICITLKKNPHPPKARATKIKHSAGRSRRPGI